MPDPDTDRDDRGQFASTVSDMSILAYFDEGRPFHTAHEVAEQFDLDRSTAYRRLSALSDDGELEKVTLGTRTVVWWRPVDHQPDAVDRPDVETDPFLSMSPSASGKSDVAANADRYLAEAAAGETDTDTDSNA